MDEMELMMHLHRNNKRQGPGSPDFVTQKTRIF